MVMKLYINPTQWVNYNELAKLKQGEEYNVRINEK